MSHPTRLGRYAVRRRIGSGGFATVWLAYDEQLDSPVAIKVLADNWTEDHHVLQRFVEEGRYLRRVESPHVVPVYDAGELEDGRPYLVMAYADQGTLADRLDAEPGAEGLTVPQAVEVVRQVGAGLTALHARGILHRDVKPANVLFRTVDGAVRVMLGDLGLGKALDMSSRLTMVAGTPTFVAPEQAQAEPLDARADQYSLAVLTYLLLAGRAPYAHATLTAAAAPGPPPPLPTPDRPLPEATDAVVRRALARDREERFPDVASFVAALEESLEGWREGPWGADDAAAAAPALPLDPDLTQAGARPGPPPAAVATAPVPGPVPAPDPAVVAAPRSRRRWAVAGLVGGLALLLGGAGGYLWHAGRTEQVRLVDDQGSLGVAVPGDWERVVAADGWTPPNDDVTYPALSVGTVADWNVPSTSGEGVFLGLFPGTELPTTMPQHPECEEAQEPVTETTGDPSRTVVHTGCPDGITVERVVQVAGNRLLWVQVRSADRATANGVLDSVDTYGI
ncbi:serine/threonine-protein kinase [Nocardioides sp. Arc9.136]|uniref:serine/threonine-protein kinase n=1 Tax=Nocardioides sp. Arc9.136 TaxID=2996826 RepID=UPI0026651993|nr:serine/threonine-protein kinase [Nocardioides sp. Arc9.136]WKN48322.1 serine/threonine-protein kinase [Nocardioides sp. Arc9.136]